MKDLLLKVKEYIEQSEQTKDSEWGEGRLSEDIVSDGDMPELYFEVLKALEK